jgi:two-component system LytT family sensor kinase
MIVSETWETTSFHGQVRRGRPFGFLVMFLVWTLIGLMSYGRYYFQTIQFGPAPPLWHSLTWLACFYPWVLMAPVVFWLESRFSLSWSGRGLRNFMILLAFGIPLALVAFETRIVFARIFEYALRVPLEPMPSPWQICGVEFVYHNIPYWVTIGGSYILRHLGQLRDRERETARLALEKSELESSLRLAELEALRMKLNPHFLFNTLQNISVLALQDPHSATLMLTRLGDLLRASFRKDSQQEIPLQAEIALTQAYLEIERVRFRDRLSVVMEIEPLTEGALVPTFLLQPLVENAIKHGLTVANPSGRIEIRGVLERGRLVLTVADNGAGISTTSLQKLQMGVGLGSTFERLNRLYPNDHEFTVRKIQDGGTEVRIALPFHVNGSNTGTAHARIASLYC